jgi:hypothetical protein
MKKIGDSIQTPGTTTTTAPHIGGVFSLPVKRFLVQTIFRLTWSFTSFLSDMLLLSQHVLRIEENTLLAAVVIIFVDRSK